MPMVDKNSGKPIPPPPGMKTFSANPTDDRPERPRGPRPEGNPKRYAEGTHAANQLQVGHVIPSDTGGPDRIVHSVSDSSSGRHVRITTQVGNQLPVVETFPIGYRFNVKNQQA